MIALTNCSTDINVVHEGSPSRMRRVLRISLGITILPKSSTRRTIPVAVPDSCLRRRCGCVAFVARLGCPISSLPTMRLRQLSTPAHTYAPLYLPLAARSNVAAATHSGRLTPPPAALPSLPCSFHISFSFYKSKAFSLRRRWPSASEVG